MSQFPLKAGRHLTRWHHRAWATNGVAAWPGIQDRSVPSKPLPKLLDLFTVGREGLFEAVIQASLKGLPGHAGTSWSRSGTTADNTSPPRFLSPSHLPGAFSLEEGARWATTSTPRSWAAQPPPGPGEPKGTPGRASSLRSGFMSPALPPRNEFRGTPPNIHVQRRTRGSSG